MRAFGFEEHGGVENFKFFDVAPEPPEPGPGEALVRIKASALNHLDIWVCRGWPGLKLKLPHICGSDGAGVVEKLGEGAPAGASVEGDRVAINPGYNLFDDEFTERGEESVSPGYLVIGEHVPGTHAEYAVVPVGNLLKLPDDIAYEVAAATGLVWMTAQRMLFGRARLKAGQTVLVVGAGGGVNSAAIQLAKNAGCTVYATTSTREKAERARALGADEVINYIEDPEWASSVYKMTEKRGVDVVVDNVGRATLPSSLRAAARGGKVVIVGNTSGPMTEIDIRLIFGKQLEIIGSTMGSREDYSSVMEELFKGRIRPVIDRILPLERGVEGVMAMATGEKFGKVILMPERSGRKVVRR